MKLIVLYGIPGVGKKTVGQELEKITGMQLMDNHSILDLVRRFLPQKFPVSVSVARHIRLLILKGLIEINSPGLIITFAGGSSGATTYLVECVKMVEEHGGEVFLVELACELQEVRKRIEHPSRKGHFKVVTQQELDEFLQKDYFKGLPGKESIRIDNTYLSATECAKKIVELIGL
jgi:adenylylsulfate kinase-like enzyme